MEYTRHDREWVIENLDEFETVRKELEAMKEFEDGVIYPNVSRKLPPLFRMEMNRNGF